MPQVIGPFIGYKFQEYERGIHIPYKILDQKLVLDPSKSFSSNDDIAFLFMVSNLERALWENGKIEFLVNGRKENNAVKKSYSIMLKGYSYRDSISINQSIAAGELTPDYYEAVIRLMDSDGNIIDSKSEEFVISSSTVIGHPISFSKGFPLSNSFLYYYMLASQNRKLGRFEEAESLYSQAYKMNPDFKNGVLEYTSFLVEAGKYEKAMEMMEIFKDEGKFRFQYYLLKGKALMGLEKYKDAIDNLLEGNKIYNSDTGLLNSLGFCYYKIGQSKNALDALKASLKLNPKQENVKNLIDEIEGKD